MSMAARAVAATARVGLAGARNRLAVSSHAPLVRAAFAVNGPSLVQQAAMPWHMPTGPCTGSGTRFMSKKSGDASKKSSPKGKKVAKQMALEEAAFKDTPPEMSTTDRAETLAEAISMKGKELEDIIAGTDEAEEVIGHLNQETSQLYREGKYRDATIIAEQCLRIAQKHFGEDHAAAASASNNAAVLKRMLGEYEDALPLYRQALKAYTKLYGDEHPSTQVAMHNLASCLKSTRNYEEAEVMLKKLLKIRETLNGPTSSQYAISLLAIANLYDLQKHDNMAEPYYQKALAILKPLDGYEERLFYSTSLNNMGLFLKNSGRFDEARTCYEKSLSIRQELMGKEHPGYADVLHNLIQLFKVAGLGQEGNDKKLLEEWISDLDHFQLN